MGATGRMKYRQIANSLSLRLSWRRYKSSEGLSNGTKAQRIVEHGQRVSCDLSLNNCLGLDIAVQIDSVTGSKMLSNGPAVGQRCRIQDRWLPPHDLVSAHRCRCCSLRVDGKDLFACSRELFSFLGDRSCGRRPIYRGSA